MDEKLRGEQIKLESRTPGVLLPLAVTAITAFARAAGGKPGALEDQTDPDRTALESHSSQGASSLLLTVGGAGVDVRNGDEPDTVVLLTWSA